MRKAGADPKVKKTLLRNYEHKVRIQPKAKHENDAGPSNVEKSVQMNKDCELDAPTLCSSEKLANYLKDVKNSITFPLSNENHDVDKTEVNTKVTKKLNFHFNDRMYKNLVELNIDVAKFKSKDKRTVKTAPIKRDIEPNIDDFCEDEKEIDVLFTNIPVVKHRIKPIRRIEDGRLHRLVASFETL